ncbi:hypothetical protein P8452_39112 [Trifolium repens]|nr:hypothetical protein P8452_39112 [Trifolium repens]
MHNQDQTPGHENHGVYVCHKCGWPYPNPHPSAKHRRSHKKICGTIQGYKHQQTQGLVVSGSNNENDGIEGKLIRSESEVYSDAVADFSDNNGSSPGVKQILQQERDSLDSGIDFERVNNIKEHTLLASSKYNDFNAADESPLIANSSNDGHIKNPKIPPCESSEVGNTVGSQGQSSVSTVDPLTSSIADLKTEESSIVHGDGFSGLSRSDEVKSERDMVEILESTDSIVSDGAVNPMENKGSEFVSLLPQNELPVEVNSSIITNDAQLESARAIQSTTCSEVKVSQEKEDMNVNIDPLPVHDDKLDVAYPQSELLKHEEDVTNENNSHFNTNQLSERSHVISSDMNLMDSKMKTDSDDCSEVSLVELTTETYQRPHEIGVSMKPEMNENNFSEEHGPGDIHENSQPESSFMVSSNEYQRETSFQSATDDTFNINNDTAEINDVSVDGKIIGANVENDTEVIVKDFQPSDLLQPEVEQSSDLFRNNSDDAGETGKIEGEINSNINIYEEHNEPTGIAAGSHEEQDAQLLVTAAEDSYEEQDAHLSVNAAEDSHEEQDAQLSVNAAEDFSSKHTPHSSINTVPSAQLDSAVEDDTTGEPVQDQSNNTSVKFGSSGIDTSADSLEARDAQLLVKAIEDLASKYTSNSFINAETSAVEDNSDEVTRVTDVPLPVQDQSVNNLTKLTSPGTEASVDSGSRRYSLDGNWGSSSVISMISDAPAVLDGETLPSTGPQASTEASKSDVNIPRAAPADRQLSGKSETFELPSFTTLVEPSHVAASPNGATTASEIQNPQQSNSTSQAAWFPTLNQVINEPQGRKKNEETISKITKRSSSKEHTPLKSLLGEATNSSSNPKSPKMEENNKGSGLTTVNSILGPESPSAAQTAKEKAANEWNSPARYPANIKREKKKLKSRPFWIQLVCCSTVDPQRR